MLATRRLILIIIVLLLLLLFIAVPGVSWAQGGESSFTSAARVLADKIVAFIGRQDALSMHFENRSSLSHADVISIRKAIEDALAKSGVAITEGVGTAGAMVTFSENPQGLVWIVQVSWNDSEKTIFLEVPQPAAIPSRATRGVSLRTELFWEQAAPIVDVVDFRLSPAGERLLAVLQPNEIRVLEDRAARWNLRESFPLPRKLPVGRDPRGSIESRPEGLFASFQGETCTLSFTLGGSVLCELWRNQTSAPSSAAATSGLAGAYSGILFELHGKQVWLYTASDGVARLARQEAPTSTLAGFAGWGSELAAVRTNCGSGVQALVTRPTDWTEPDAIQAFEFRELDAVPVSAPLIVSGPVLKLHVADVQSALAVVRNLQTGRYEVHSITLTCGR